LRGVLDVSCGRAVAGSTPVWVWSGSIGQRDASLMKSDTSLIVVSGRTWKVT
jgi:hypothetical protein